ncbi:23S rRNA (uracil1939-C5)-methyltransferase [Bacilli bacterium PM5-9]|nr:23S rRNA (uracil1939-C5)-methyltransferase [Bacilli bacterium PM5-9]
MKNKIFESKVVDYTHDGKGIIKYDGYPLFVKGTIIGEMVETKIVKWKKKYGFGRALSIKEKSLERVVPLCLDYKLCGGCQIQHMSYNEQISFKKKKITNAFAKQKINFDYINIIENENQFNYRNKLSIPLGVADEIYAGLYQENSNNIIKINDCLIQSESINSALKDIVKLLNEYQISIYDKSNNKGYLRQLVIREAISSGDLLIGFVINSKKYNGELDNVIEKMKCISNIKSIVVNFNCEKNNVILGKKSQVVYGDGYIIDNVNGKSFRISLTSFYQVNTIQMNNLYNKAIEMAQLNCNDIVFDAYCGVGTISIYLASNVKKVVGVDIVESSIRDANINMELNKISNIEFICNDVGVFMKKQTNNFDCVFLDPPRKGCSQEFLEDLININPNKVVYISCDVATQARDIRYLIDNGYSISEQCAVDMFSQTHHVENIILLTKVHCK